MKKILCFFCFITLLPLVLFPQRIIERKSKSYELTGSSIAIFSSYITETNIDSVSAEAKAAGGYICYNEIAGDHVWFNIYPRTKADSAKTFLSRSFYSDTLSKLDINPEKSELRIAYNEHFKNDWKKINLFKICTDRVVRLQDNRISYLAGFEIVNRGLTINDTVTIEIRNPATKKLQITFKITRVKRRYIPFLATMCHDSSTSKHIPQTFIDLLVNKDSILESVNEFYKDWEPKDGSLPDQGTRFYASSKILFIFRKYEKETQDSSLEYQLLANNKAHKYWRPTGHMLIIDNLQPNTNYLLQVRYASHPENIFSFPIRVAPKWYQTQKIKYQGGLLVLLLIVLSAFFTYRQHLKKIKAKKESLALEIKSIRSQLNPHFVFNALSSIQSLINKKEIDKANLYLSEFSSLMRDSLYSSDTEFVPLTVELRMIETYMKLEQLRFNFNYSLAVDPTINQDAVEVPSLLFQPLIENAVRHGIAGLSNTGAINITLTAHGRNLVAAISDNGQGFDTQSVSKGYGLKLTTDRIRLLNQTVKKQPIKMQIESNKHTGTTVHLVFENWLDT